MQQLKGILLSSLKTDAEKLAYEFSTGENGTREIAKLAGLGSKSTVERYWEKWSKIGIVEPAATFQGRMQRICSLKEVGIDIPIIKAIPSTESLESSEVETKNE